jgi:hypothetical protein
MKRVMPWFALTSAVEHIALQLEAMHLDIKETAEKPTPALTQSSSV